MNILLVSIGAIFGAVFRWQLGVWLNSTFQAVALGTLFANVAGCFLIGIALGLSLQDSQKLLFVTGFLGSFTTFSSLWAEIAEKLLQEKWWSVLTIFSLHTLGGLCATLLGIFLVRAMASGRFY
ncbi:chromosome condensation protein CrcB [Vespertiliibacter pulmonis]|uniref:Fluoride-specific ion channel FluC n=1 Tax=Vespertiliibacter pulmonis TaxID=1443036 RepID=A0A3N4W011_9PAST|nr:CrcB family protein [Vespertiliibacter pulmonis]QLB20614.1 chromosome condensation protein CrcB [Vespertiliibacter pulmonis]RPE82747.1 camphor resistance protein CrcB [Vespertiliibacter pulmonis]